MTGDEVKQATLFTTESEISSRKASNSKSACAFCQMVQGELATKVVFEDELTFAFLDKNPLFRGHCLVIPKKHYETLMDLPVDLIGPVFSRVQLVSRGVQKATGSDGIFNAINNRVSQSVPHVHVHVIPRKTKDGLKGFFWPRQGYESEDQAKEIQRSIKRALSQLVES